VILTKKNMQDKVIGSCEWVTLPTFRILGPPLYPGSGWT